MDLIVAIMTHNEEYNIKQALTSCSCFRDVVVCDSFSDDQTQEIVNCFPNTTLIENQFKSWGDQRNYIVSWILAKEEYKNKTHVMFLDADEIITPELRMEIEKIDIDETTIAKFKVENIFMGKKQKYSYRHPEVPRLFCLDTYSGYQNFGAREYYSFNGNENIIKMKSPLVQCDNKPFKQFLLKQVANAVREAEYSFDKNELKTGFGWKNHIRQKIYQRIPLPLAPVFYFIYNYVFKFGFLDGKIGFYYIFYQSLVYQMNISFFKEEIKNK